MVKFNNEGLVKCEICGQFFARVCNHANKAHNVKAKEYRIMFGLGNELLISEQSRLKTSNKSKSNYHNGIVNKFIENSKATRYKPGESGRKKYHGHIK